MTEFELKKKDIRYVKGVGEKRAELFQKLGVSDADALLRFYPRSYEDWSNPDEIFFAPLDSECCIKATIETEIKERRIRRNLIIYYFRAGDASGSMNVTIFNNKYLADKLQKGREYLFYGKITGSYAGREMSSPQIQPVGSSRIRPIYKATEGLTSAMIEGVLLKNINDLLPDDDMIPEAIRAKNDLCSLRFALKNIHFPESPTALDYARKRLIFEELFVLQTGMRMVASGRRALGAKNIIDYTAEFQKLLPFELTNAQKRVINECAEDMSGSTAMSRLVQGDVGSGKTAVAAALMYSVAKNGYLSAMMAPTTILATQHYNNLKDMLEGTGIRVELLIGSTPKAQRNRILADLAENKIDIIVGTHALLTDGVEMNNLTLVVTDEQHRFGVAQRAQLLNKGDCAHLLVMSATPIPRTLSLVVYGDLDISVIDELPKGRQVIETYAVNTSLRERAYGYVKKHLDEGRQGYIVCPMVEENGQDVASVKEFFDKTISKYFIGYSAGLMHGKLSPKQKEETMQKFISGETQLLVSTTVIEVGIDVPNAVIMVIENSERFGLSQLHQLRGRIGRGKHKSTCILITDAQNDDNTKRSEIMCKTNDGFIIAQEDLLARGPGDFLGKRQHGLPDLKIADMLTDMQLMKLAGHDAAEILKRDPKLSKVENKPLKSAVELMFQEADTNILN